MLNDTDPEKVKRVTEAMLKMKKIEIKTLIEAYAN
jgi:predicted 3-demethylubiquinone-9 3-methyltransferase (glyoxalase superfamily)